MKIEELKNKKILILGYGKEGKATQQYLYSVIPGLKIDHTDKNTDPLYLEQQKNYDLIIKTPGIPKSCITQKYTTATNIFFANCSCMIIGVTGTKGKSTTSSLIYHLLKTAGKTVHLVGNIGNPALLELLNKIARDDIFIMELSSYQLDDIQYSPHISVILNLFPEHMNYHGNVDNYYQAKLHIISHTNNQDYLVFNSSDPLLQKLAGNLKCQTKSYVSRAISLSDSQLTLIGDHNKENIKAALTVCDILHIPQDKLDEGLKSFKPLPHRLEKVGTYKEITFYDDAISTTPQSTIAALNALPEVDTLFLGGQDRGYDFGELINEIGKRHINNIVFFPDSGNKIQMLLKEQNISISHMLFTSDMEEAVTFAYLNTKKGSICLLSTASPSYSVWKNFEEKGNLFRHFVETYGKK